MVTSASLTNFRIKEFIQFIRNTQMIVSQHGADKLKIKAQYNALNQAHKQLEQAYKQDTNNDITAQLAHLDDQRDQALICLRQISEGYTHHHAPTLKAAGTKIVECISKYGNRLYSLNYSAETAALKNITRDLQTIPECVSAIQALGLKEVVQEMKRTNLAFETLFIQRLKTLSQFDAKSNKERMQLTSEAYRTLVKHLEAHATLTPSDLYTSLINHMNENVDHFNHIVERRKMADEPEAVEPEVETSENALV